MFFGIDLVNFGEDLGSFTKFIFVIICLQYIEMAATELNAFLVGIRKNESEMAAFLVLQNILYIISMLGLGLAFAVRTYLNKAIGEKSLFQTRLCISNSYILCVLASCTEITIMMLFEDVLANLFTSNKHVVHILSP
jgi:Na+-driven multidrug efflux pump